MSLWGAVGAIGSSLVGGLFGKKKQSTETTVNYVKMARKATQAGFNPLTALRNGGSAGFTTTTAPTVSTMPETLANLGGVLGDALGKKLDPIEAKKRELDTALVDAQLRELKQGPQLPGRFYPARQYTGTKVSSQLVPRLGAASHKSVASVPAAFKSDMGYDQGDTPKVTNPYPKGFEPDPNTPDAETWETRLGDDILSPAFWLTAPREVTHNADKWLKDRDLPRGPYDLGRRIRRGIVDLWTQPGTRKSGPGTLLSKRSGWLPQRVTPRTRVGRYAR